MKKYNYLLFLAAFFICLTAGFGQKKDKPSKVKYKETKGLSPGGYAYKLYSTGKGNMLQTDDLVYFDLVIRYKDSVLQDSKHTPQKPEYVIRDKSEYTTPNPVIDALMLMRLGDSIIIFEKIDTVQNLPPAMKIWKEINYTLVVNKVVTEVQKKVTRELEPAIATLVAKTVSDYKANTLANLITTSSGLKYVIHTEGKSLVASIGEDLNVHYYGVSVGTGKKFDSSYARGSAFHFPVGKGMVIPGWDEALLILKKGTKATIFIPSKLAYGVQGIPDTIEPNAELAFFIEVLE